MHKSNTRECVFELTVQSLSESLAITLASYSVFANLAFFVCCRFSASMVLLVLEVNVSLMPAGLSKAAGGLVDISFV